MISAIGMALVCFFAIYYMPQHMFDSEEKKHDQKVAYLQQLEIEIETDIKSGDYDSALIKANKLYCDDHWSNEQTAAWDAEYTSDNRKSGEIPLLRSFLR